MDYKKLGKILGKIMILEGVLMLAPLLVSFIYQESFMHNLAFIVPIIALVSLGFLLQLLKPKSKGLYQKEGFALTALVWIVMALFGAIPFVINQEIPNYIDACFEIMSGFTTTGASVVSDVSTLSHSTLFWRSFSHWIGGMGILVFVLIFIPESNDGSSMYLLRAESPGPQVGKIVSKMKVTTRILYLIYIVLTLSEFVLLLFDKPIVGYENDKVFISLLMAFGSAGTGGFSVIPGSMQLFNPYSQYVVAIFLILFGCNFSLYYLILIGKVKSVLKSEEFRSYFIIIILAVLSVFSSLLWRFETFPQNYTTEEAFRHSLFQVATLISTAGFTTTDFAVWPMLAVTILIVLMFMGSMAGSSAGGIKLSRIIIAVKGVFFRIKKLINPRYVPKSKFEGKTLEDDVINDVFAYLTLYFFIFIMVILLLAFDPVNGQFITVVSDAGVYQVEHGFFSNFSATLDCICTIGPGFEALGPYACYAVYSPFSKILLSFIMLLGRLEILPVLILFSSKTWKKV